MKPIIAVAAAALVLASCSAVPGAPSAAPGSGPSSSAEPTSQSSTTTTTSTGDDVPSSGASPFGIQLTELKPTNFTIQNTGAVDFDGKHYPAALLPNVFRQDESQVAEYDIGGRYSTLTAVLGNPDATAEDLEPVVCKWKILVDLPERTLTDSTTRRHQPIVLNADIRGAIHLRIETTRISGNKNSGDRAYTCAIADGLLKS